MGPRNLSSFWSTTLLWFVLWSGRSAQLFPEFFPDKVESVNSCSITAPLSVQILRCHGAVLLRMVPAKLTGKTEMKRLDED